MHLLPHRVTMARYALTVLDWSNCALLYQSPPQYSILLSQARLLCAVSSTELWINSIQKVTSLWSEDKQSVEAVLTAILEAPPCSHAVLMLSVIAQYCTDFSSCKPLWERHKV